MTRSSLNDKLFTIIELILLNPGIKQTQLMQKANANHCTLAEYVDLLRDNELLLGRSECYKVTKKGLEWYVDYFKYQDVLIKRETFK